MEEKKKRRSTKIRRKMVTFTIDNDVLERFRDATNKLSVNRSRYLEEKMLEFIEKKS